MSEQPSSEKDPSISSDDDRAVNAVQGAALSNVRQAQAPDDEAPAPAEVELPPLDMGALPVSSPIASPRVPEELVNEKRIIPVQRDQLKSIMDEHYKSQTQRTHRNTVSENQIISYKKLVGHMKEAHPCQDAKNEDGTPKKFGICDPIGLMPVLSCCSKEPTKLAQELGVGPTLFLMSTRAMAWLFFLLTLINVPAFAYYYKGTSSNRDGDATTNEATKFTDYFTLLSLGNVGQSSYACGFTNFARVDQGSTFNESQQIQLSCGLGSRLGRIVHMGLSATNEATCGKLFEDHTEEGVLDAKFNSGYMDIQVTGETYPTSFFKPIDQEYRDSWQTNFAECLGDQQLLKATDQSAFEMNYDCHCKGKESCSVPILNQKLLETNSMTYNADQLRTWPHWEYSDELMAEIKRREEYSIFDIQSDSEGRIKSDNKVPEPELLILAVCEMLEITDPFSGQTINKGDFGMVIVLVDVFVVVFILLFTWTLEIGQENFVKIYDEGTIEMQDFSLRVKKMPDEQIYSPDASGEANGGGGKDSKAKKALRDEALRALLYHHFSEVIRDQRKLETPENSADSNDRDFTVIENAIKAGQEDGSVKTSSPKEDEIADICFGKGLMCEIGHYKELTRIRNTYLKNLKSLKSGEGNKETIQKEQAKLNDEFNKAVKALREAEEAEDQQDANDGEPDVKYAFVVFRDMHGMEMVKRAYNVGAFEYWSKMSCFGGLCCPDEQKRLKKKHFFKKWPKIEEACEPDNIKWENLRYSAKYRRSMALLVWVIAFVLVICSLIGIVIFKVQTDELEKKFASDVICPVDILDMKKESYLDYMLPEDERIGLLGCYCKAYGIKYNKELFNEKFDEFVEGGSKAIEGEKRIEGEDYKFCNRWAVNFALQNGMVIGSSLVVVAINVVTCTIFEMIVVIERKHSVNEETVGQFSKITIMQFINIAIVVLCVNFDFIKGDGLFLGFIPIFNGDYPDFTVSWYAKVGKTLCFTLLVGIFSPYGSKLAFPALKVFTRLRDRGCCQPLKKEGTEDQVNTEMQLQNELDALYTGDQISSHYVYAQNYTYLWCVLMFSTGMPILYPFACIFYMLHYWVYKFLLVKYYSKTTKFNQQLPIYSLRFIKIGLIFHVICGGFMVTNSEIIPSEERMQEFSESAFARVGQTDSTQQAIIEERFLSKSHGNFYFAFIILIIVFLILKNTVFFLMIGILKTIWAGTCGQLGCFQQDTPDCSSGCFYKELTIKALKNLYSKTKAELANYERLSGSGLGTNGKFNGKRFEEEPVFQYGKLRMVFQNKQYQIEGVINDHLKCLHGESCLVQLKNLNFKQKLEYLMSHEQELKTGKAKKKKNEDSAEEEQKTLEKSETKRIRLEGVTLSYDLYESSNYKNLKEIQQIMDQTSTHYKADYTLEQYERQF